MKLLRLLLGWFLFSSALSAYAETLPAVTQRTLRLGGLHPLSGPASDPYSGIATGIQAYFQYVNDQGGLHGRQMSYQAKDTQLKPSQTEKELQTLALTNPVFALIGTTGQATLEAYPTWLRATDVLSIFAAARPAENLPASLSYLPSLATEATVLGKFFAQERTGQKVLLWLRDTPRHAQLAQRFEQAVAGMANVSRFISRAPLYQLEEEFAALSQVEADAVVVLGDYQESYAFVWQHQRWNVPIYTGSAIASAELATQFDPFVLRRLYLLTHLPTLLEKTHAGVRLHTQLLREYAPETPPSRWTLLGHAIAETSTAVLHRVGPRLTSYRLKQNLQQPWNWQGQLTPPLQFPIEQAAVQALRVSQILPDRVVHHTDWISAFP